MRVSDTINGNGNGNGKMNINLLANGANILIFIQIFILILLSHEGDVFSKPNSLGLPFKSNSKIALAPD